MRKYQNRKILNTLKLLIPITSTILLMLFFLSPNSFSFWSYMTPSIAMCCVYYWLLNGPENFDLGSVYIIGALEDLLSTTPLGVNIITLLVIYIIISNQEKFFYRKTFDVTWWSFSIVAAISFVIKWVIISIYYQKAIPVDLMILSYCMTFVLYPIIAMINNYLKEKFLSEI